MATRKIVDEMPTGDSVFSQGGFRLIWPLLVTLTGGVALELWRVSQVVGSSADD
jgi:hypothetical protein